VFWDMKSPATWRRVGLTGVECDVVSEMARHR